jgi:crossover junction endodeoxyribonuclease RusA
VSFYLEIRLAGEPVPKGRPRFGRGHVYTPKRTRDYEQSVGWMAKKEMAGRKPQAGPVSVEIGFYYKGRDFDLDNAIKSVLDGMNGIVYENDRQVEAITAYKFKLASEGHTHVWVKKK